MEQRISQSQRLFAFFFLLYMQELADRETLLLEREELLKERSHLERKKLASRQEANRSLSQIMLEIKSVDCAISTEKEHKGTPPCDRYSSYLNFHLIPIVHVLSGHNMTVNHK